MNAPLNCACGSHFSVEHALSCPKGWYPSTRHNEIRDLIAALMSEVCRNVSTEPHLQPMTGDEVMSGLSKNPGWCTIAADDFWGSPFERAFLDVKVFNPYAP